MTAKNSANGMVAETTIALRRLPRNNHCTAKMRTMPKVRLVSTFRVVRPINSERS